jgi:hypothetical protein
VAAAVAVAVATLKLLHQFHLQEQILQSQLVPEELVVDQYLKVVTVH